MNTIVINAKSKAKTAEVLQKLQNISDIEIKENPNIVLPEKNKKKISFSSLKNIFKDDIDAKKIREEIWQRKK